MIPAAGDRAEIVRTCECGKPPTYLHLQIRVNAVEYMPHGIYCDACDKYAPTKVVAHFELEGHQLIWPLNWLRRIDPPQNEQSRTKEKEHA